MEEASSSTNPTLFLGLIEILSGPRVHTWAHSLGKSASRFWSSLQYRFVLGNSSNIRWAENKITKSRPTPSQNSIFAEQRDHSDCIYREDVEMVMGILGLSCSGEVQEKLNPDEITRLFEDNEPSLEELKEAFYVFDVNRDGFIDAKELQSVLCGLGFSEGKKMEDCKTMIQAFDENGDGRIDFREFVKFMENCFC